VWLHAARPVLELAELAAQAEQLGAAAILVADEGTDRDLFVTLAALVQRTRRVLLFAGVTNPHSRHPVALAAAFASLDELAPGRIVAGFGTGGSRVLGPIAIQPAKPYSALVETLDVVEALWRGETVTHHGEVSVEQARLSWRCQRLPVAVAGRGRRVERLAAQCADWILLAGRAIDRVPTLVTTLRAERQPPVKVVWNPSLAWTPELEAEVRSHLAYMLVDMPEAERAAFTLDRFAIVGKRAEVVARLRSATQVVQPELVVFEAHDYSNAYLDDAAKLAREAGLA
jgi:alkanesulfonate monooxygenase SsuD/methylene tetrahydromethanopterin reductase-like flavin-dependent oxidoreductase (luciferase family)